MGVLALVNNILHRGKSTQRQVTQNTGGYKPGRYSRKSPPPEPGAYRWVNIATGLIEYVGETANLERRSREHERSGKQVSSETHHYEWKKANPNSTSDTRRVHERKKIRQHKPTLNQRGGGGGRKANG